MAADKVETIHGSVIQHGLHNDRIYLMHLHGNEPERLLHTLDKMAVEHGYGKIFAKIPATVWQSFLSANYVKEAVVPGFYNGATDGLFVAKFFSENRRKPSAQIITEPLSDTSSSHRTDDPSVRVEYCSVLDADEMAFIYREVFESYAFPIHRSAYIRQMMSNNVIYCCVRVDKRIAALSAAEIDADSQTCEMTDFATLPEHRCKGFAGKILDFMETKVARCGVITSYTIARADSRGMNRVFSDKGYHYAGCLLKNTQIGGRIRSMHVWYKPIPQLHGILSGLVQSGDG